MDGVDPYLIKPDGTVDADAAQRAFEALVRKIEDLERRLAAAGIP